MTQPQLCPHADVTCLRFNHLSSPHLVLAMSARGELPPVACLHASVAGICIEFAVDTLGEQQHEKHAASAAGEYEVLYYGPPWLNSLERPTAPSLRCQRDVLRLMEDGAAPMGAEAGKSGLSSLASATMHACRAAAPRPPSPRGLILWKPLVYFKFFTKRQSTQYARAMRETVLAVLQDHAAGGLEAVPVQQPPPGQQGGGGAHGGGDAESDMGSEGGANDAVFEAALAEVERIELGARSASVQTVHEAEDQAEDELEEEEGEEGEADAMEVDVEAHAPASMRTLRGR